MKDNIIAIITARGGSKRIPKKNIKPFLGSPIIKYPIDAAIKSNCFDEVMVSTDDREIAAIAESYGANIPFFRSETTSNDYATTADVLEEVILQYKSSGMEFKYLCCLYPTAPFVSPEKIQEAMRLLVETSADCVLPVVRFSYPIQRALTIRDGRASMMWPENYNARSQDLCPAYHDSGQFYCMRTESFMEQKKLFLKCTIPLEMPESEVQDIDNEEDWKVAEMKYEMLTKTLFRA